MKRIQYTKELLENAVKESHSLRELAIKIGLSPGSSNSETLKKKLHEYNIDFSHFTGKGWNKGLKFRPKLQIPIEDLLKTNTKYQSYKLLRRLINDGIKEHKCEVCGNTEWLGVPIPLELHHIDGDKENNTLSNLQVLCPNCHAQTPNYRGKKKKVG